MKEFGLQQLIHFNESLALSKFKINTVGYAIFLKEFIKARKEQINK